MKVTKLNMKRAAANFTYQHFPNENGIILISDIGPWHIHPTITNDAENVIKRVLADFPNTKTIFYTDSEGELGELCFVNGVFTGFGPGPSEVSN